MVTHRNAATQIYTSLIYRIEDRMLIESIRILSKGMQKRFHFSFSSSRREN